MKSEKISSKKNREIWDSYWLLDELSEIKFVFSKKATKIEVNLHRQFDIM